MFVDSDDYLQTDMCEQLMSAIKMTNADIAVCKIRKTRRITCSSK